MKSTKIISVIMCLIVVIFMIDCTKNLAGSEVTNEKYQATIYLPNGKPAKNAKVFILPYDFVPSIGMEKNSVIALSDFGTTTDDQGHFSVTGVADGRYNVWAEQDSLVALHNSVYVSKTLLESVNDTLNSPVSLSGIVRIQPNHNVATVIVQALGTNIFGNVNSKGQFTLIKLARGEYRLKFSTSLPAYVPAFVSHEISILQPDSIKDTVRLVYNGIPVVTNIKASFDSVSGVVRVSWNPIEYFDLKDYMVYRSPMSDFQSNGEPIGITTDSVYYDTLGGKLDIGNYGFNYQVAARDNSRIPGVPYKSASISVSLTNGLTITILGDSSGIIHGGKSQTLIRAEINSPYSTISKVQWSKYDWYSPDSFFQTHIYPSQTKHVFDTVLVVKPYDSLGIFPLVCRVTDSYGHTASDTTLMLIPQDSIPHNTDTTALNNFSVALSNISDSIFVNSSTKITATIHSPNYPLKQIKWKATDIDSTLRTGLLPGNFHDYTDSTTFLWKSYGRKTIVVTAVDSSNAWVSDSAYITVLP